MGIERLETLRHGYRHQEVAPHVPHHAFDLALVIPLAGTTEPILEQVVGLELAESPGAFATTVSQYLRHREFRIVVPDALGRPTQKGERRHVIVEKGLGGLPGIGLGEAAVAVGQVQDEVMHLALHAGDHRQRFAEVALGVARSVGQGHEHLPNTPPVLPHVVLDYGLLAFKSVLVPQPLEDALGRVPLLSGRPAIRLQDGVNYAGEGLNLRFARRPLPRVALGRRIGQHLAHRVPMQAEHSGGLPNAHPLHQAGLAHPKIRVHVKHPSHLPTADIQLYGRHQAVQFSTARIGDRAAHAVHFLSVLYTYVLRGGIPRRLMPHDLPPWGTVWWYFRLVVLPEVAR